MVRQLHIRITKVERYKDRQTVSAEFSVGVIPLLWTPGSNDSPSSIAAESLAVVSALPMSSS